ncbi:MAG TPA: c-type cytochrome [Hyphomicrobiaceae bacterium]|nr:c-type cytochrome [Hyphomicrobiaceae bacterium]
MVGWFAAGGVALGIFAAAGLSQAKSTEYLMKLGEHLAQECTSCHRIDGTDNGIPSIVGLDPEYFINSLTYYKDRERTNPIMVSVAESLDKEQIEALALYFHSLGKKK